MLSRKENNMADKKVDAATGEVNEQEERKVAPIEEVKILRVHCKPVFNYQSVEFDCEVHINNFEGDITSMETIYTEMLQMLVRVSEKAPQKDFKPVQQVEEPATEKQIEVMNTFHIKYPKDVTRKQAQELIKANISAVK